MERLKELRKKLKQNQTQVANYLGITVSAYGNYELGQREPDNATLTKLADYFGVSTDYLLERDKKSETDAPIRPNLVIPEVLQNVGIGFHNGAENLTQEDIDDMALALEIGRKRRENK